MRTTTARRCDCISGRSSSEAGSVPPQHVGIALEKEVKRGTMARSVFCMAMDMMMTWPGSALACAATGRLPHPAR